MKPLQHLSPSGISLFQEKPDEFYMRYLADNRPPGDPQSRPMSIGSAFDAYVKAFLHERLFGKGHKDSAQFGIDAIFEAQVEPQWRDWARVHGQYAFDQYKAAGCLGDLCLELMKAKSDPRFEFDVKGTINGEREGVSGVIGSVILFGKPDVYYINEYGCHVILDFKVNGYCSKASPIAGYVRIRSAANKQHKQHKDCIPMMHKGMMINIARYLEQTDAKWAQQLAIYAWLLGCPVGDDFLVGIDQLACDSTKGAMPEIRVAEHRTRISDQFQRQVFNNAADIWDICHSDHIFRDLTKARSAERCKELDEKSQALRGELSPEEQWFAEVTR